MRVFLGALALMSLQASPVLAEDMNLVAAHLNAINPMTGEEKPVDFSGEVNGSFVLQDGNADKESYGFDGKIEARRPNPDDRFIASLDYDRAKDNNVTTEDDMTIEGVYDYFFKPKWFFQLGNKYEKDKIADLKYRYSIGPALGYQPIESDEKNLKYSLGVDYLTEESENGDKEDTAAAAWSFDYDQMAFDKVVTFFHNHDVQLPMDDTEGFLFESVTGIKVPVAKALVGTAEIEFDWDNDPAPGAVEDDTKYTLKLGYAW